MIDITQVKTHLNITHNNDDTYLQSLIMVSVKLIQNITCNKDIESLLNDDNEDTSDIEHAQKLLIGHYYLNREAVYDGKQYEIPLGIRDLLSPYKNYTIG